MQNHLINFDDMPWTEPGKGVKFKALQHGNQQIRLVEFSDGFIEEHWCTRGHAGHVLEGSFAIDYGGAVETYRPGDTFFIAQGESDKHKAILDKSERVLLLLFETI